MDDGLYQVEGGEMKTKTCYKCKSTKPIALFSWDSGKKDNHSYMCMECNKNYQKKKKETKV